MIQKVYTFGIIAFAVVFMVLAPLLAFFFLKEFYFVGIKEETGDYPFASEHAINVGGPHYANAELYAQSALIQGVVFVIISVLIYLAVFRKRLVFAVGAAIIFLANLVGSRFFY